MKKASEVAKDLISYVCSHPKEHQWFAAPLRNRCLRCIASAIQEQVKEALEEVHVRAELVDCAGLSSYEVSSRIVTAIRNLIKEIEDDPI